MATIQTEPTYEIGEFAKIVGLSAPTIRYYENQGLLKARRSENGRRYFTHTDIQWVQFLLHLKGTGMSINNLKKYVAWQSEGDSTIPDRLGLLKRTKEDFMDEYRRVQHHLQILNDKIDWYEAKENGEDTNQEPFADYLKRIGHQE